MNNIVKQEPLQKISMDWRNPLVHRPPAGLEETLTLTSENVHKDPLRLTVQQIGSTPFKPVSKLEDDDYGHYVEMGGKKKRRTRKKRHGKKSRKSKKNRKSKRRH